MIVYFFFLEVYLGEPIESEEMGTPIFFEINNIPLDKMAKWDRLFIGEMLKGHFLKGELRIEDEQKSFFTKSL